MSLTYRKVAQNLNVAVGTLHNVLRRFQATGDLEPTKPDRSNTRKLSSNQELLLVGLFLDNPGLYLGEVCREVADITGTPISPSTVCHILHRHGFSRNNIQQIALQQSAIAKAKFMGDMQFFHIDQIVCMVRRDGL